MAALTWRGWADPLVDFGRELYVPWRLAGGATLHNDIAWFNGPLSQYWNAVWFRLFGPGMSVLFVANGVVLVAVSGILHRLVRGVAGRTAAGLATGVFLLVFAFGQYVGIANYNWVAPYAHELTHGVALALGGVAALAGWRKRGDGRLAAVAGVLIGLCFLTKVEAFLAGAAGSAVLLLGGMRRGRWPALAVWLGGALVPPVVSLFLLGPSATLGAFPSVLAGEVAELPFYRAGLGLDDPGLRLAETLTWASIWALGLGIPVSAAWLARETTSGAAGPVAFACTGAALLAAGDRIPWTESLRPLQAVVGVVLLGLTWWRFAGPRGDPPAGAGGGAGRAAPVLGSTESQESAVAFGLLSLTLLAKMALNVRSAHYGFALAAPATVFTVAALWSWLPGTLDRLGLRGDVLRGSVLALLMGFSAAHVRSTQAWMERKTETVGEGVDAFRTDLRGAFVQLAVDHVRASGYESVAVLPEGVMINFLARVPNPTPYVNFMPPEEILFTDAAWVDAFRAAPPDAVILVPKDTSEFGRGGFGSGYGAELGRWVREEYVPAATIRLDGINYGVRVLVRGDPT